MFILKKSNEQNKLNKSTRLLNKKLPEMKKILETWKYLNKNWNQQKKMNARKYLTPLPNHDWLLKTRHIIFVLFDTVTRCWPIVKYKTHSFFVNKNIENVRYLTNSDFNQKIKRKDQMHSKLFHRIGCKTNFILKLLGSIEFIHSKYLMCQGRSK